MRRFRSHRTIGAVVGLGVGLGAVLVAGGCQRAAVKERTAALGGGFEASVYVCPEYIEYGDQSSPSGNFCEIEQQFDGFGSPEPLFNFYPATSPAGDGFIQISDGYLIANDPGDPTALAQCCQPQAQIAAKLLRAVRPLAQPAKGKVCGAGEWRKASGNAPDRVDGVKQWELDNSQFQNAATCNGVAGAYLSLKAAKTYTVQKNSSAIKVAAASKKTDLLALIATGGLASRADKYELWLASREDKDFKTLAFGLADEVTPLANDFCVVYNDGGKKEKVQAKGDAGHGHPTIAAFLNATADAATKALGGFWGCDGGEGTSPAKDKTQNDNCSGRWPPSAASVVDDARLVMNGIAPAAPVFWDGSKFFDNTPGNKCP